MNSTFGRGRRQLSPYLLLAPGLLLYVGLALGPSLATSLFSFTDASGVAGSHWNWIGLDNYKEFLFTGANGAENLQALIRTLQFCVLVSVIQFGLGLLAAVLLNQKLRGTRFFRTLFFLPVILGVTVQALIWQLFLWPLNGPVEQVWNALGMTSLFTGGAPQEAFLWVVVVQIWANMGITMVVFLAGLQTVPEEIVEAARMDGANSWQVFRHVTWPLITPAVNTNLILNIIGSLQAWQLFFLMLGWKTETQVLGYVIFGYGFGQNGNALNAPMRQGYASAGAIVMFFLVLTIGMSVQYLLRRRESRLLG